jgi:thiol-disulfide isomerase/thioredoxin
MNNKAFITSFILFLFSIAVVFGQSDNNAKKSSKTKIVDLNEDKYSSMSLDDLLKKHKGKVIYLDFWASWCGPCKKEMPYSQNLKKEYSPEDVAFVYISTDKNGTSWVNMIDNLDISGYHYRASPEVRNEIIERFNLQYIPRYVLINKDGKVADANAKRPSDPMVKNDINKLLL